MIDKNRYKDTDKRLGFIYHKESTTFRVWAPLQEEVKLAIYENPYTVDRKIYPMELKEGGYFEKTLAGDYDGKFYSFLIAGQREVTDPYSRAMSRNSLRSAVVDMKSTDPEGWEESRSPEIKAKKSIIMESSIKDITGDVTSSVKNRGKFLGLAEKNTYWKGQKTGLAHLKELGITHIQLMPFFDFISVDESPENFFKDDNYNWGYDPEHYNAVEGSYSTDPEDPKKRIYQLKKMIMTLHEEGIRVVMDVVYNHTYRSKDSNFSQLVPSYYYRQDENGNYSNGSGVGNELASERPMVRRFIVDSLLYWQREYKIDGFRFDLMALTDIDTMILAIKKLRENDPDVLIYGEPWMALGSSLDFSKQILPGSQRGEGFSLFNADYRDAIKGDNDGYSQGYVQGNFSLKRSVETGLTGSIDFDDIRKGFCQEPLESINYFNSHDNLILEDKLTATVYEDEAINQMTKLSFGILMVSQGIPFFHLGNEFRRSKKMSHNSYNQPMSVNAVDWSLKGDNRDIFNYYRDLIKFRKAHPQFSLEKAEDVRANMSFIEGLEDYAIAFINYYGERPILVVINAFYKQFLIDEEKIEEDLSYNGYDNERISYHCIIDEKGRANYYIKDFKFEPRSVNVIEIH